ncbi:Os01g0270501, partial [Oryza sativa Japonica Group]
AALLPDIPFAAGEHVDASHLLHGHGERGVELDRVGEVCHHLRRGGVLGERGVGRQRALLLLQVGVVTAVELERRGDVEVDGGRRRRRVGARRHERLGVGGVEQRVEGGGVPLVQPRRDAGAAGLADGVRAGERDEVGQVEPAVGEALEERAEPGERRRQRAGVGRQRHGPVAPPGLHLPQRRLELVRHGVARGERHDVRARHHPGARLLQLRLDGVDHLVSPHR